jgi:hypothetical protein
MNTNNIRLDTKKVSKLRIGAAVLSGTVGIAVVGLVALAVAFAGLLQSGGGRAHPPAHQARPVTHHGELTMAVVWVIAGAAIALGIVLGCYFRSRRCAAGRQLANDRPHVIWFTLAASALANVSVDVDTGTRFTYDLIFAVVAVFLGALYLMRKRRQSRAAYWLRGTAASPRTREIAELGRETGPQNWP